MLLCLGCVEAVAQQHVTTLFHIEPESSSKPFVALLSDSAALWRSLHSMGYWQAAIDSCWQETDTLRYCRLQLGRRWLVSLQHIQGIPASWRLPAEVRYWLGRLRPFDWQSWQRAQAILVQLAENQGYPFASLHIDTSYWDVESAVWHVSWRLDLGHLVTYDSLLWAPATPPIEATFLRAYLGIQKGNVYRQQAIEQVSARLQQLGFVQLQKPPEVRFAGLSADVRLPIRMGRSSQVQGFVGFLPNEGTRQSLLLTGELNVQLLNLFRRASVFRLYFNKMRPESEQLNLSYLHRRLLGGIDAELRLQLLREDTLFVNVERLLTLSYPLSDGSRVLAGVGLRSSRLAFSPATTEGLRFQENDFLLYRIGWEKLQLDDIWQPKRGWILRVSVDVGNKQIRKNPFLPSSYYDSLQLRGVQWELAYEASLYRPVKQRHVLLLRQHMRYQQAATLLPNEWLRLGGLRSLRGFNENFFFTPGYMLHSLEWQWLADRQSYFFLFSDFALLLASPSWQSRYWAAAAGAGLQLRTQAGNFRVIYALGTTRELSWQLSRAKIHFGYVSTF